MAEAMPEPTETTLADAGFADRQGFFDKEFLHLWKHCIQNFLLIFTIFFAAYVLTLFEDYCAKTDRPEWFCEFVKYVSIFVFTVDAGVFAATVTIISYKSVKQLLAK